MDQRPVCAVTGATGYVGSRIALALGADFKVVPMGRRVGTRGIVWGMGGGSAESQLRECSVQVLVHAAWDFTHPKPAENWKSNVEGSRKLITEARAAGVAWIIFVSSISAFDEARSQYGKAKVAVERLVLDAGGTVIRPGLVWGERPGGMFASLREQVKSGGIIPMVGTGQYAQYLIHEDDLAEVIRHRAKAGPQSTFAGETLTVARTEPWLLRDLILRIARDEGTSIKLVSIPWRLIYAGLRSAEILGFKLNFRSDSLISLVYSNRQPQLAPMLQLRAFL